MASSKDPAAINALFDAAVDDGVISPTPRASSPATSATW